MPRKAIKACPGRGQGPLSHLESGHAVPTSLNLFLAATTQEPRGPGYTSANLSDAQFKNTGNQDAYRTGCIWLQNRGRSEGYEK